MPLTNLVEDVVQANVSYHIRPLLGKSRVIGLEKTDEDGNLTGEVQPIAIGEILRRWITRALCFQLREQSMEKLSPYQYAVGIASGQDKLLAAIRTFLASGAADEKRVVISLNAKNGLKIISCQATLERVNSLFPELTEFLLQWYGELPDLWFAHEDGLVRIIKNAEGTQ